MIDDDIELDSENLNSKKSNNKKNTANNEDTDVGVEDAHLAKVAEKVNNNG